MNLTVDELFKLFEEVEKSGILLEEPRRAMEQLSVTYDGIPEIPIAELPWAKMDSNDEGVRVSRQQIQQFLQNITGEDLYDKIDSINKVMNGDPEELIASGQFGKERGDIIGNTISYLVFLKTLTNLISNFNASSAGFSFEAFLGVLLGGGQIATGQATIADLKDKAETPISLKLYQEKAPKAGGSWTDLVGDLTRSPNMMQYVVVTKDLQGEGSNLQGVLKFYRFNLTLQNIVDVMYNTGTNKELVAIPRAVFANKNLLKIEEVPRLPNKFEKKLAFDDLFDQELGGQGWSEDFKEQFPYQDFDEILKKKPSATLLRRNKNGSLAQSAFLKAILRTMENIGEEIDSENIEQIGEPLEKVLRLYRDSMAAKEKQVFDVFKNIKEDYVAEYRGKTIKQFYDSLSDDEKTKMLYFTFGYRKTQQFDIYKKSIYNINKTTSKTDILPKKQQEFGPMIGQVIIGRENVQAIMNKLTQHINTNVFEIFQALKSLTGNLQAYFAEGLKDNTKASEAIVSSKAITKKTQEVQKGK